MQYLKTVPALIALIGLYLFTLKTVSAADTCQPIYGGGQTCLESKDLTIDKKVFNPITNTYVENLGLNDPKYAPSSTIKFQLNVKNTSTKNSPNIIVKDILPQFVEFVEGPGTFDPATKTFSMTIGNLAANQTKSIEITGRTSDVTQIPANQTIVCVVNQSTAEIPQGAKSQDNSQFCIERGGVPTVTPTTTSTTTKGGFPVTSPVPVEKTPSTGAESLALFSLIPTAVSGWMLRKYSLKGGVK